MMKLNSLLSISAVYMALLGIGFLVAPDAIMFGSAGAGASAALLANLRAIASMAIGIAVLNWFARNAEPSKALNAIVLANTVGFGLAAILEVIALFSAAPAAQIIFAVIDALIAVGFASQGRATMAAASKA
ncbi:MAG: hypothetical protein KGJ59_12740 [Bacteroidota bacterium]|nr:hypothetical protein [Bacteroidota bacterium]